jgi:hypothetical protein
MLRAMPSPNISGAAALALFGGLPSFRNAEVLSVLLNRQGVSIVRVHAWNPAADVHGRLPRDGEAIVVFEFQGIRHLRLESNAAEGGSVTRALLLEPAEEGYRLELRPSRGIGGEIVAEDIAIRIEGGR